jgi:hypothetical protein
MRCTCGLVSLALVGMLAPACSPHDVVARWNELRGDAYALDRISREVAPEAPARCSPDVRTTEYRGRHLQYGSVVLVAAAFEPKLVAFERTVVQLASSYYGRAPERLLHFGVRACRRIRGGSDRLSEHALANAVDVAGFRFGRAQAPLPAGVPASLRGPFTVSIKYHWKPRSGEPALLLHDRFLRGLVERVRSDRMFRGIVGPGREGHADHFHFDYAPWSYMFL